MPRRARNPVERMGHLSAQKAAIYYQANQEIIDAALGQIREGLTQAFVKALQAASDQAREFAKSAQIDEDKYRENLFRRLGELAQDSMLRSYDQLVGHSTDPYRAGQGRLAGGILRRALQSPAFFRADAGGLEFGDVEWLDSAAAHWHRLNFGAAPHGQGTRARYPVSFGTTAASIGIDEGPSPGFSMPPGFWLSPNGKYVRAGQNPAGTDRFFPSNRSATSRSNSRVRPSELRPTRGIKARNFMDAGIRRLAEEIPKAYRTYIDDLLEGAIKNVTPIKHVEVSDAVSHTHSYGVSLP